MLRFALVALLTCALTPQLRAQQAKELPKLVVLKTKVAPSLATIADDVTLTNLASAELDAVGRYQVLSFEDVAAMLDAEQQKQMLGCDEVSCIAELGSALGARYLFYSQVGEAGEAVVASASIIDAEKAVTLDRQSLVVRDRRQIVDALKVVTRRVLGQKAELEKLPPKEASLDLAALTWPIFGAGAGVALLGGLGTGAAYLFAEQALGAPDQSGFDQARSYGELSNGVAVGAYALGGTLLVVGTALFVVDLITAPAQEDSQ